MPQIPEYQLFAEEMGPILWKELIEQGVKNPRVAFKNMITQLGYESQYGTTRLAKEQNNYGGVGYNDTTKKYSSYKDKADFAKQYVKLMNSKYKNAIGAKTLTDYAKAIRDIGYYTDTLENYANNLNGMKSFQRAVYNHVTNNPQLYSEGIKITKSGDGNKVMKIDPVEYANVPQYESTWSLRQPTNTIYPLNPADRAPESIDSWNGAQSPSKGPVMPSLQKQIDERQKMYDLFDEYAVSTDKKKLMPRLSDLLQKSKDNYIADILGINNTYEEPGYTYTPMMYSPMPVFADGKLPKYRGGKGSVLDDAVQAYDNFVENDPYHIASIMSYLPIIGTAMDIREAVKNPTAENIGYAGLSGLTDLVGGRIFAKVAGNLLKAKKMAKAVKKAELDHWRNTPFYQSMPKQQAEHTVKYYAKRAADEVLDAANVTGEFMPEARLIPAASVYFPDFIANVNQQRDKQLPGHKDGKSPIRIKPENRGKLTRLKKRTGKSESELYNDGNPAHKKMVVFARNARKWKH